MSRLPAALVTLPPDAGVHRVRIPVLLLGTRSRRGSRFRERFRDRFGETDCKVDGVFEAEPRAGRSGLVPTFGAVAPAGGSEEFLLEPLPDISVPVPGSNGGGCSE